MDGVLNDFCMDTGTFVILQKKNKTKKLSLPEVDNCLINDKICSTWFSGTIGQRRIIFFI